MKLSLRENISPLIETERQHLISRFPQSVEVIDAVVKEFHELKMEDVFDYEMVISLCTTIDSLESLEKADEELKSAILLVRKRLLSTIYRQLIHQSHKNGVSEGTAEQQAPGREVKHAEFVEHVYAK